MNTKLIRNVFQQGNQNVSSGRSVQPFDISAAYNCYMEIFNYQLHRRFPVVDINNVDDRTLSRISEFAALSTPAALDTWTRFNSTLRQALGSQSQNQSQEEAA
jgi:hypothetical protein